MLITISRQYGAGGSAVAAKVADSLGWRVVDNELVERVAARAGLTPEDVASRDERVPSFIERLAQTVVAGTPELMVPPEAGTVPPTPSESDLVRITERVVQEVAAEGKVVLIGRAAPAVLGLSGDALHVKVVASREYRIRVAAERLGLSPEEAAKMMDQTDKQRARYHREYYDRDWNDPVNYHMVLNTGVLGVNGAAELIVDWAGSLGWKALSP